MQFFTLSLLSTMAAFHKQGPSEAQTQTRRQATPAADTIIMQVLEFQIGHLMALGITDAHQRPQAMLVASEQSWSTYPQASLGTCVPSSH